MSWDPSRLALHGAHGIVRRGDEVLVVRNEPGFWDGAFWSLPGGTADPGELLHETLVREVAEETSLVIDDVGRLAWLTNIARPHPHIIVAYFEVGAWHGDLHVDDPMGVVSEARFVPVDEAIELLRADATPHVLEPAIDYLQGRASPGTTWCYRMEEPAIAGSYSRVGRF